MAACPYNPASQEYADFLFHYSTLDVPPRPGELPSGLCGEYITQDYAVFYAPLGDILPLSMEKYPYYTIPNLYTLLDSGNMELSGIRATLNTPALANGGQGVLIGFIDTGIDYQNPLFQTATGKTRILGIWDQTLPDPQSGEPAGVPDYFPDSGISYGTEYSEEAINQALASPDPLAVVPSMDTDGHGTFLAGIAAGGELSNGSFLGAAPRANLAVVKLKPAKTYLRDYYLISPDALAFQENDIMMGIKYLRVLAHRKRMPLVILIALGSNLGSHEGLSPLSASLQDTARFLGFCAVIAAGNETGLSHHFESSIPAGDAFQDVEIRVGEPESQTGFVTELWASDADTYHVGLISPSGEESGRIPLLPGNEIRIPFLLEGSTVTISYHLIETTTGRQMVFLRFEKPAPGIWRVRVYNSAYFTGRYHMWLPVDGFLSRQTVFLNPSPNNTITLPGNSAGPITVAAYNHRTGGIDIHSSRGYSLSGQVKPDLAAPGVSIFGPTIKGAGGYPSMTYRTGTSVAAAHVAGAAASLLSWGIVEKNDRFMSQASVRSYLIRGANRNPAQSYPNREWGYGTLDLYHTYLNLRN